MDQLKNAKGVFELQRNGHFLIQKVKELKEENRRNIREHIEMLKAESEAALAKVLNNLIHTTQQLICSNVICLYFNNCFD